ncbi:acyl-CoA carboxylase subunit beta [Conexibacter sp. SYSU D00693]|uniref:acyl-CoA carboxylase subunit beta n=1 Tax=Conexibacter sp. SYSU D00693 TaxID=2812560 RepID=UPI00196B15BE|nr:carboxyl transferase domain-containing protein [Conexibacter sp. SYSU D00693]
MSETPVPTTPSSDAPAPGEVTKAQGLAELERRRALALAMGGPERVAAHHARGRLTARERVALLLDEGSFVELGMLAHSDRPEVGERAAADASVTGVGTVDGRKVCVIANDATVLAGTTGKVGSRKQGQIMSLAGRKGYPLVMLGDANGGRLPDLLGSDFGASAGTDEGEHFLGVRVTGDRIPRVTAILGNAYGDPAFWAGSSDYVAMAEGCSVALSGPSLVGSSTGAATTHDDLGGPAMTVRTTGVVSRLEATEADAIASVRRFLSYLPSNASRPAPVAAPVAPTTPGEALLEVVPDRGRRGYDVRKVIDAVVDGGSFFELHPEFARSVVVGLARVEGQPVGVLANQPKFRGGVLDVPAVVKATRLLDLCNGFGLPLVTLQDMPGVMVGEDAERQSVARRLMELFTAVARSPVPKVTVILRKAFGFGYIALAGPSMGTDYVVAWPNAEIGFMAADNAVQVVHARRLREVRERDGEDAARALAAELEADVHSAFAPWQAATQSFIHDVIRPQDTRQAVVDGLFIGSGYR